MKHARASAAVVCSVLLHAAVAWHFQPSKPPARAIHRAGGGALVLVRLAPARAIEPVVAPSAAAPVARVTTPRSKPRERARAVAKTEAPAVVPATPTPPDAPQAAQAAPAVPAAIDGSVFAMPRLQGPWGGTVRTVAFAGLRGTAAAPPPPTAPPPVASDRSRERMRDQLMRSLHERVAALPPPPDGVSTRCHLVEGTPPQLVCDDAAVQAALTAHAPTLPAALAAYRALAADTPPLAVAFSQGQYRLETDLPTP